MKYDLKPFQITAVEELLKDMERARRGYYPRSSASECSSCGLSAVTGSGKTIMAAAAIEAILNGSQDFGVQRDPLASILWVTDSPNLNEQTRKKFLDATDIDESLIITIGNTFTKNNSKLQPGHIYFLNRQLLGAGKLLTKGGETLTFWQMLEETYRSNIHLYMFLDEAHRGLGAKYSRKDSTKATIYQQIIDGTGGAEPMPIVVGLSATIQRFKDAMQAASGKRTPREPVRVEPSYVRESGLLKDKVIMEVPARTDAVAGMYLTEACTAFDNATKLWKTWSAANPKDDVVIPLFVIQVGDKITDQKLLDLCRAISDKIPWLDPQTAFANVFGEETNRSVGSYKIPYVEPEDVQESTDVRVLFAKEAISTGWDCPRAEVIYSLRAHSDSTYIAQLIGRMVRTPLARRVDLDTLNIVYCYLPAFNSTTVENVINYLTKEDFQSGGVEKHIIEEPVDVEWDSSLGCDEAFDSIRMRRRGSQKHNWINGLFGYTGLLALHEIDMAADAQAHADVFRELTDNVNTFAAEVQTAKDNLYKVQGAQISLKMFDENSVDTVTTTSNADAYFVKNARVRADGEFGEALTNEYFRKLKASGMSNIDCNIAIAAAASVQEIVDKAVEKARMILEELQKKYNKVIAGMDEKTRADFESDLFRNGIARIVSIRRPTTDVYEGKGATKYAKHLMNNPTDNHMAPFDSSKLNTLETQVVSRELRRGAVAWYRNPSHGGSHALSVPYMSAAYPSSGVSQRSMYPDFIFFERENGKVMPYLVDPHGAQLADSLEKLKGFAEYAEEFGGLFTRIWSLTEIDEEKRYLDLKDAATRQSIQDYTGSMVQPLYRGTLSHQYT